MELEAVLKYWSAENQETSFSELTVECTLQAHLEQLKVDTWMYSVKLLHQLSLELTISAICPEKTLPPELKVALG